MNVAKYYESIRNDRHNPIRMLLVGGIPEFIPGLHRENVNGTVVYVGRCPSIIASNGAAMSAVFPMPMNNGEIRALILTDAIFDELSPKSQEFLLLHEKGHIANGDLLRAIDDGTKPAGRIEKILSIIPGHQFRRNRKSDEELRADAYAADRLGADAGIRALMESKALMKAPIGSIRSGKEIDRRIKALQKRRFTTPVVTA